MTEVAAPTRRERQRQQTLEEIVTVSRELLREPGGLSLRAVAQKMGITAPALYRYVASYQELVHLIAQDIDASAAVELAASRDRYPHDDPAAQIVAAAIAFRRWALTHREEFGLVFANPLTGHDNPEEMKDQQVGLAFNDVFIRLWRKYDFPVPPLEEIHPSVVATFDDPYIPARLEDIPADAKGLLWVFMQSWVQLYGTVTLEVFGHCDPRVIESGALFYSMLTRQAEALNITDELPRLLPMIESELAR
ncbi:MAG TPA: WHG domain-containing protein [Nocardioidaceae bacterium]|nr:WHG domain-containing protein [Nocardioidaceae bacterium]